MSENGVASDFLVNLGAALVLGITFRSEDATCLFCNSYARITAFGIRKHYKSKSKKNNRLLWGIFCCLCQGE